MSRINFEWCLLQRTSRSPGKLIPNFLFCRVLLAELHRGQLHRGQLHGWQPPTTLINSLALAQWEKITMNQKPFCHLTGTEGWGHTKLSVLSQMLRTRGQTKQSYLACQRWDESQGATSWPLPLLPLLGPARGRGQPECQRNSMDLTQQPSVSSEEHRTFHVLTVFLVRVLKNNAISSRTSALRLLH